MKPTAIVTGAYGAIGKAIAEGLASGGCRVFLVSRDPEKLESTKRDLIRRTGNQDIFTESVELSSRDQIISFSKRFQGPLHILVNNAATGPRRREETPEGIEMQWAVNVLSYVWMMRYFKPYMVEQPDARIVNVASYWAGGLDLSDVEFKKRRYDNDAAYRQSKQADRMLTVAFANEYRPAGITVNSCHPGDVNSKLSNFFGFGGHETPAEGAATPLHLALSAEMAGVTGRYFEHLKPATCNFSRDSAAIKTLYDLCTRY